MEDALVQTRNFLEFIAECVLILVLMEDALVLKQVEISSLKATVLILVLMEDALVLLALSNTKQVTSGLNPCFNGRCTRTG